MKDQKNVMVELDVLPAPTDQLPTGDQLRWIRRCFSEPQLKDECDGELDANCLCQLLSGLGGCILACLRWNLS